MVEHTRMEKVEIGMACFVVKKNMAIRIEVATPPPPIPATVHRAIIMLKVVIPAISTAC